MKYLMIYLLLINAVGFALMRIDKRKAIKNRWRIPERALILTAVFGGSIGCLLGMYAFRHKTKHLKFTLGIPAVLAVQCAAGIWLYANLT